MGTKLSMAEKEMMAKVIKEDLTLINTEITRQFRELWEKCRTELERELGIDKRRQEIDEVEKEIEKLKEKVGELQSQIKEYDSHPKAKDYQEAGIEPPDNKNGYIYNHDREYFGIAVNSIMDILIVKKIKSMCDPERPLMMMNEIAQAAYRALIMSGTYDEARKAYQTFYELDFQRYGVKIPRRLEEIKKVEGHNLMSAQIVPVPLLPAPEVSKDEPDVDKKKDRKKDRVET